MAEPQLLLDLGVREARGRDDFMVAPSNEIAVAWIDRWPDWPGPGLVLYGPPGSGKSHLAQVWRQASAAVELDADRLASEETPALLGAAEAAIIDDIEGLLTTGPLVQEGLLHLYNVLRERRGHLLLTSRSAPSAWDCSLPDLRSRLLALQTAALEDPGDELLAAVLVKLFKDRQVRVTPRVIDQLLRGMERSFAGAQALVAALDAKSLARGSKISEKIVREMLADSNRLAN